MKQRHFVVKEFVDTEELYVRHVKYIVDKFLYPIRAQKILPLLELGEIFSNVEIVHMQNAELARELKAQFEEAVSAASSAYPDVCIGQLFLEHVRELIPIYTPYCLNQGRSVATFERCSTSKKFTAFTKLCADTLADPACENQPLMSFLIKPVQRLCKYPLLLRELLKNTPATHPDREPLLAALSLTQSLVDEVNSSKREAENVRSMMAVTSQLSGADNLKLLMPGRRFLMEASMVKISVHNKHQTRQFFLFNDLMIYAAKTAIGKHKYSFKGFYYMNQIDLVDVADTDSLKNAFCIIRQDSIKKKHVIYCDTPKEKADWLKALSQCMQENTSKRPEADDSRAASSSTDTLPSTSSSAASSSGVAFKVVSSSAIDSQQQLQMVDIENKVEGWTNDRPKERYLLAELGPIECQYVGSTNPSNRWAFLFNDSVLFTSKQSDKAYGLKHFFVGKHLKFRAVSATSLFFTFRDETPFTLYFEETKDRDAFRELLLKLHAIDDAAGWVTSEAAASGAVKVIRVTMTNPSLQRFGMLNTFKTLSCSETTTVEQLEEQMLQKLTARIAPEDRTTVRDACNGFHLFEGDSQLPGTDIPYSRGLNQLVFRLP